MNRMLFAFAALLLSSGAAAQDLITPSDRVTSHVKIRSVPSETATEIGQLNIGDALPIVNSVPRWHEVRITPSQTGFVSKSWTTRSLALAPRQNDELRIHFLNIGAGTCTIVECPGPNARPIIVDCGSLAAGPNDMSPQEIRTYVRGILAQHQASPNVVLSHGDTDHFNQIANALDTLRVNTIWQGGDPMTYGAGFRAWLARHDSLGVPVRQKQELPAHFYNDREPVSELSCGTASTYALTVNTGNTDNSQSLVLMIEHGDFTAVFTGDAEGTTEARALTNFAKSLKASVMTSSHHGAATNGSNSVQWADTTAPAVLISSAGTSHKHPRCAAINNFTSLATTKRHDVRCGENAQTYATGRTMRAHYVTALSGAVIITSNGTSPMTLNCTRSVECGVKIVH